MDSYAFQAKRIKLDISDNNVGETCKPSIFSCFSATIGGSMDSLEGPTDCDSGYEASSTMSSLPTVSQYTSPQIDAYNLRETALEAYFNRLIDGDDGDDDDDDEESEGEEKDQTNNTNQENLELEDDDNASTVSELSGLSDLSGNDWKPMANSVSWIQQQIKNGVNPRMLLKNYGVDLEQIPEYVNDMTLWKILIDLFLEPPKRDKLRHINTMIDVVRLLRGARRVVVLTGAGVSVSCGIPDFRSKDGIYSRLAIDFPNLPDPQSMFDINYFSQDPRPFFKFARDIYPGKFKPSPCHRFIKLLEKHQKLLRNYTQNIDTLEKEASIERVIECHGSFATATCTKCEHKVEADKIREIVLAQQIPLCEICNENNSVSTDYLNGEGTDYRNLVSLGIMKPDIVFFGEGLPDSFHKAMTDDKSDCDLLLVIGSSLKVRPVALIPNSIPPNVPQILINREPLPNYSFDVELLGDCDIIINHICKLLGQGWEEGIYLPSQHLVEVPELLPRLDSHKWVNTTSAVEQKAFNLESEEGHKCECDIQQRTASYTPSYQTESQCECNLTAKSIKERHISIDSARDSGISENSNLTDIESESKESTTALSNLYSSSEAQCSFKKVETTVPAAPPPTATPSSLSYSDDEQSQDMRGFWQPKVKQSLAERLPADSFYLLQPSRYIFPGAEVYYDPDDKSSSTLIDDDSRCSDDTLSDC